MTLVAFALLEAFALHEVLLFFRVLGLGDTVLNVYSFAYDRPGVSTNTRWPET